MCVTDRRDMTLALKVALNPNTTNQVYGKRLFGCTAFNLTLSQTKILELFADDNFEFDECGGNFLHKIRKTLWEKEKLRVTSNFSFSLSVFKRLVPQTRKNQGLFGKELMLFSTLFQLYRVNKCTYPCLP